MTNISGHTSNGFTYEGHYEHWNSAQVRWTATYRRGGIFFGMRHGRLDEIGSLPLGDLDVAVKDDIEFTWSDQRSKLG